ncbi:hypothetical protein ABCR94_13480 [Streptomyces sp. 21So2-11]|uniref:hypothetical protein n=1 Tax=Streptomyces sp. 21So2-11 TaxID=3144408 RepID=UPI00321983A1
MRPTNLRSCYSYPADDPYGRSSQVWLQIEASYVAGPYAILVATARAEVGAQLSPARQQPPTRTDEGMDLGSANRRN